MATPKKPSNKKVTKQKIESTEDANPLSKVEKINIDRLFEQALVRYKQEQLTDKKDKLKEVNHLALIAEEYLSCFALIGYSLQDEKVVIFNMPTSKDEAALIDLLRSTFIEIAQNRP